MAEQLGAQVVKLPHNLGKGGALLAGVREADAEYVMFIDADLIGLKEYHIESMLSPIRSGEAEATMGVFKKGRGATDLAQKIAPRLSGQRVIKTSLVSLVKHMDISRFGVEMALNRLWKNKKLSGQRVELPELSRYEGRETGFGKASGQAEDVCGISLTSLGKGSCMVVALRLVLAVNLAASWPGTGVHNHPAGFAPTSWCASVQLCLLWYLSIPLAGDPSRVLRKSSAALAFWERVFTGGATIRGLTTAASLWSVAGVGMAMAPHWGHPCQP